MADPSWPASLMVNAWTGADVPASSVAPGAMGWALRQPATPAAPQPLAAGPPADAPMATSFMRLRR